MNQKGTKKQENMLKLKFIPNYYFSTKISSLSCVNIILAEEKVRTEHFPSDKKMLELAAFHTAWLKSYIFGRRLGPSLDMAGFYI